MTRIPSKARVAPPSNLDTLLNGFSEEVADSWLRQLFGSFDSSMRSEIALGTNKNEKEYFDSAVLLGYIKELPKEPHLNTNCPVIVVCVHMKHDLVGRDSRVAQFNLSKRIIKEAVAVPRPEIRGLPAQGLFFFRDDHGHFRLSLVTGNVENKRFVFNSAKRQSFFVNEGGSNPTIRRRFNTKIKTLADLKEVFSVEALTKAFYKSLFDWYLWATEKDKTITFPNDLAVESDNRDYLETAVIRLLTRLMFIWFIKQKGLVPDELFEADKLGAYIKDFEATSKEQDNYYRVILQNLFFATLNCKPEKRKFKRIYRGMSHERGIATCYRYVDEMQNESAFKELMAKVPFLNCALFDCLDKKERDQDGGRELYLDGFSDREGRRAHIHNAFFFDEHQGLIPLFNQYEFTVDENSATDTDVALDPELLGKVFENLLGSYNPETRETARKATGAFYTPREIVNYMVRESLKSYLRRKCSFADDARLDDLFDETKTDQIMCFNSTEKKELLDAIYTCKILDPACGSGAFPMGVLHIMVSILNRLDKDNLILRGRLLEQYKADKAITITGLTEAEQQERVEMLDKQLRENITFPDYARKLYLIENCIYGIDIQPIATQISKLRFFISLLCDQLRTSWNPEADNHGLLSLPNLEAKFVCADSLLSLPKLSGDSLAMGTANIQALKQKLESNRHLVFTARTIETKNKYKARELEIRDEIRDTIKQSLSTPDAELIATLEAQLLPLRKQLAQIAEPKIELRRFTEQSDLFSSPQLVIREIDVNEAPRVQIKADIANIERAIETEKTKAKQSASTELDHLALAVSGWDPYDQNACSDFFDASWMFNINDGFDIVIGNPPYVQLQKNKGAYAKKYEPCGYESFDRSGDMYALFAERSGQLVGDGGSVCLIIPNRWLLIESGATLRKHMLQYKIYQLLNFGDVQFFDNATTCVCIILFNKDIPSDSCLALSTNSKLFSGSFDYTVSHELSKKSTRTFTEKHWLIMDANQASINQKMESDGLPLKDFDVSIYRGVLTGFNEAFFISERDYHSIINSDAKSQNIINPLLRGRSVQPYHTPTTGQYLICTFPALHINIDDYPAVKSHLLKYGIRRLEQSGKKYVDSAGKKYSARKKTGFAWFETQDSIGYWKEFYEPKIIYPEITSRFAFAYDDNNIVPNNKAFIINSKDKDLLFYLVGFLNSKVVKFWIWHHCPDLVGCSREVRKVFFENIPIPVFEKTKIIELTKTIISKRKSNKDYSQEANEIEMIIDEHYHFTFEETNALNDFVAMLQDIKLDDEKEDTKVEKKSSEAKRPKKEVKIILSKPEDDYLD